MGTPGQLIVKRYRLVRALGQGSTGILWEGEDTLLDRPVAVREILLPAGLRETRRMALSQEIAREARQAERLRHPNIAAVYDVADDDGTCWIVMELIRSRSLDGIVASDGPLPPPRAAVIARQILAALTVAHAAGVRHGDVRPANILVGHDGRVLLADFGIGALAADEVFARRGERTSAHGDPASSARGATAFLAPERADSPPRDASDLWSLGASLHFAVTGRAPLMPKPARGGGVPDRDPDTRPVPRPPLGPDLVDVPQPLKAVLTGLLAGDPRRRPPHDVADRMLADLESAAPLREDRARGGRSRLLAVAAAIVVVGGGLGGWALLRPGGTLAGAQAPVTPTAAPSPSASPVEALRMKLAWYDAPTGWRAGVPKSWKREETEYSTWWRDPLDRGHLVIEVTGQAGTDPLGALTSAEAILAPEVEDYKKLKLRPVASRHGSAADWEFTWRQTTTSALTHLVKGTTYHQYRRVIATPTGTSVLSWTTTATDWDRLRPTLLRTFRLYEPPKA